MFKGLQGGFAAIAVTVVTLILVVRRLFVNRAKVIGENGPERRASRQRGDGRKDG